MKLYGVTTTYNCERLVPFVMKYAKELGYDKLIVYDNESTDNTVELLKQYPFVEVRTYHTEHFCEQEKLTIKLHGIFELQRYNEENGGDYAWCTACDFDEVYFFNDALSTAEPFKAFLFYLMLLDFNICTETFVNILSKEPSYDKDVLLHLQADKIAYQCPFLWNKPNLFRLDNLHKLYFSPGQHYGEAEFNGQEPKQFYNSRGLFAFHLKLAFGREYAEACSAEINKRGAQATNNEAPRNLYDDGWISKVFDSQWWYGVTPQEFFQHKTLNGYDNYEHLPPKAYY